MKNVAVVLCTLFLSTHLLMAATVSLKGTVKNSAGNGIEGVNITLAQENTLSAITDAQGAFSISGATGVIHLLSNSKSHFQVILSANKLVISPVLGNMNGRLEVFSNNGRRSLTQLFKGNSAGTKTLDLPEFASGLNIIRLTIGKETITKMLVCLGNSNRYLLNGSTNAGFSGSFTLAKLAAEAVDTIIASKIGYKSQKVAVDSYEKTGIAIVLQEENFLPRNVIFSEGFEGTNLDSAGFRQAYRGPDYGWMSITTKAAHSGTYSLASDSNKTGIRKLLPVDQFINDSIGGLEFYFMATKAEKTEFYAAFGQGGNSAGMLPNGWQTVFGMGIDTTASLWCMYEKYDYPQDDSDLVHKTCGTLELNKWYKCNIEYDFEAMTLNYYLNNVPVYSRSAPWREIEECVIYRDTVGTQGPKNFYVDDITVYKR